MDLIFILNQRHHVKTISRSRPFIVLRAAIDLRSAYVVKVCVAICADKCIITPAVFKHIALFVCITANIQHVFSLHIICISP